MIIYKFQFFRKITIDIHIYDYRKYNLEIYNSFICMDNWNLTIYIVDKHNCDVHFSNDSNKEFL